jgi:serine/threonine protein kinase
MASKSYREGDQPVSGYALGGFLGRGGFGEVWQATGPGGIQVAVKIIHDLNRQRGGKELRALRLLKNIRHPNLVPLLGFWLKDHDGDVLNDGDEAIGTDSHFYGAGGTASCVAEAGVAIAAAPAELVIAMGLCETSLFERFEECRRNGDAGIPADELLSYMEDAAKSVDFLNAKHEIQHCDIKPQNILLISGAAQVGDFGLAKMIGDLRQSSTVAGTIAYGAPELLLGHGPSPFTDQYSLAISYVELRSGSLPFSSERISDVLRAKQCGEMELSLLTPHEQQVIARAAAVDPDERFPNCMEMVRALQSGNPHKSPGVRRAAGSHSGHSAALVNTSRDASDTVSTKRKDLAKQKTTARDDHARRSMPVAPWIIAGCMLAFLVAAIAFFSGVWSERAFESSGTGLVARAEHDSSHHAVEQESGLATSQALAQPGAPTAEPNDPGKPAAPKPESTDQVQHRHRWLQVAGVPPSSEEIRLPLDGRTRESSKPVDSVRDQVTRLASSGDIIETPKSPADFYHNAIVFEQRGDARRARESYGRFLAFRLNVVDVHARYQKLLTQEQGVDGARLVYRNMADSDSDLATRFASILLEPDSSRLGMLREFEAAHPDFAPATYELSLEYSAQRLGPQGLADKVEEKNLLERFEQQFEAGQLCQHYLQQTLASDIVEEARARLLAVRELDPALLQNPVSVSYTLSHSSWTVHIAVAEITRDVRYRIEDGDFESTGLGDAMDQRTGARAPKLTFELPHSINRTRLSVVYSDIRGRPQGPYEFEFDASIERVRHAKSVIDDFPNSWISFADRDGQIVAQFTHLLNHRYAIEEIRYSVNSELLDQKYPLPPEPPGQELGAIPPGETTFISVPNAGAYVAVQLVYRDNTTSKVHRFQCR